ncbi:MAG: VWA domain-containing protein [Cyanobacteria bacterium SBLK]|nr:VWA domain-containing protein [Cyanobacteria bacterium SBLK]
MLKTDFTIPSDRTAKELGKVSICNLGAELQVNFTILMEPQGQNAEGWQTGVALDASASMKDWYGRMLQGSVPPPMVTAYEQKGWVTIRNEDGRDVQSFQRPAYEDAIKKGFLKSTANIVEPLAQKFIGYLAENLDARGGTTVIYWAGGDGKEIEEIGDLGERECRQLKIKGVEKIAFGLGTHLTPAIRYFCDRFPDAKRGMYLFITDGKLDDLVSVKQYSLQLARQIATGQRNAVKCVLIGVGDAIDERQFQELDDLKTGTDIDIWDSKIAKNMRDIVEIFAEVVDENQIVAPTGTIYDSQGKVAKKYTDGLPAKASFSLPISSQWFELEVMGQKIRQVLK